MKNKIALLTLSLSLAAASVSADHNRGYYAGAGISQVGSDPLVSASATRDNINLPALELVAGYKYNGLLGLELRYGIGSDERDLSTGVDGERLDYALDDYQSVYYRVEMSNPESKLYFLLGHSEVSGSEKFITDGDVVGETSESFSGLSYGIGAGWFIDDHLNINIEYRALVDGDLDEFDVTSLSFDYRFQGTALKFW